MIKFSIAEDFEFLIQANKYYQLKQKSINFSIQVSNNSL